MPFTPIILDPVPLLDAVLYDALGDLRPRAQLLEGASLSLSFADGSIVAEVVDAGQPLARLTFFAKAFHEALRTVAAAQHRVGGHVLSAADLTFWLGEAHDGGLCVASRLTVLWPPRPLVANAPLTVLAHGCSDDGSLALVLHLAPDAARRLVDSGGALLADLAETARQLQGAADHSLADLAEQR